MRIGPSSSSLTSGRFPHRLYSWPAILFTIWIRLFLSAEGQFTSGSFTFDSGLENFAPNLASPEANITCLGELPALNFPREVDFDFRSLSLQELCAKPQYGGKGPGKHLGGYCQVRHPELENRPPPDHKQGDVVFDLRPRARPARALAHARVLLYCRTRCWCNFGINNAHIQPVGYTQLESTRRQDQAVFLEIDRSIDWYSPPQLLPFITNPASLREVETTDIAKELSNDWKQNSPLHVSFHPENKIECTGGLPYWPLPLPYHLDNFTGAQDLCAAQLSGGNPGANAGGYCHRNTDRSRTLWFSDELTPRREWTWDNLLASGSIRFFCRRRCVCAIKPEEFDKAAKMWQFLDGLAVFARDDGSLNIKPSANSGSGSSSSSSVNIELLPASSSRYDSSNGEPQSRLSAAGSCGPDGRQFCDTPWPTSILGPIPTLPPDFKFLPPLRLARKKPAEFFALSSPGGEKLKVDDHRPQLGHGKPCHSQRDCVSIVTNVVGDSNSASERYHCVVPRLTRARLAGLDPIFPQAICALLGTLAQSGLRKGYGVGVGGNTKRKRVVNGRGK